MRKNNMLRIASVLLVAVLLSTCVISGAFAKYMVSDSLDEELAAVANWGVKVAIANDGKAFSNAYGANDLAVDYSANETDKTLTVQANTVNDLIVAPGTTGSFGTVTVTDNANREVDMLAEVEVDFALAYWTIKVDDDNNPETPDVEKFYCPIVIKVTGAATPIDGESFNTAAEFEKAVEDAIAYAIIKAEDSDFDDVTGKYSVHYDTDVACNSQAATGVEITWEWDYAEDYTKDTQLGDAATKATIALDYTVTFTQVD